MTTPTGTISMSDVNVELSKTSTALVALDDTDVRTLAWVPSGIISMDDLRGKSAINYGTLTANFSIRSEGQSFTFTLAGGTVPNGTYYWRVDYVSNLSFSDFSAITGSFTVSSNTGSFTVTSVNDSLDEGDGTFRVFASDEISVPTAKVTSPTYTITETTTYTATITKTSIYRFGGVLTSRYVECDLSTTQVAVGTVIYTRLVSVSGSVTFNGALNTGDIMGGADSSRTVTGTLAAGTLGVSVSAVEYLNGATVASKTFRVQFYTDSGRTNLVATSPTITILAAPSFVAAWGTSTIAEGQSTSLTVTANNFPPVATTYYYSTGGTAVFNTDWAGAPAAASTILITSGANTITPIYAKYDATSESPETVTFALRYGSTSGTIVSNQPSLSITQALGTYSLTVTKEGGATAGAAVKIFGQITGAISYPLARSFSITYNANNGGFTSSNMFTTVITVPANSPSSTKTELYKIAGSLYLTSLTLRAALTGHNTVTSSSISSFYVG